jgi:D-3-phosphoglycerate dehydrogenase
VRILVTESLSPEGIRLLSERAEVDERYGLSLDELLSMIGDYDGLVVRSGTQVTEEVIDAARNLKIIGRAGTGVDNIALDAATRKGILVVNAPTSNSIAVAEHTIGLMLSLARHIPQGHLSLRERKWERKRYLGIELRGKVLGLIGLGRIGTAVAKRAQGLEMEIVAYDPFVTVDHARRSGVELVSLEDLLKRSDFVSTHVPMTSLTKSMIDRKSIELMKPTAYIVNCARGDIVDEDAILEAVSSGRLAGAALDVFGEEPPSDSALFHTENIIVTPHLGASTKEAQENVALDIAEQVIGALCGDMPRYSVNCPSVSPEELADLRPFMDLVERMGRFYAQTSQDHLQDLELTFSGEVASFDTFLLKSAAIKGLLESISDVPINLVNAGVIAEARGLVISERKTSSIHNFTNLISLRVITTGGECLIAGTVVREEPHIVCIDDYWLDFVARGHLLVSLHEERPGILGRMGTLLGDAGINISFVQVGRQERGGTGIMVLGLDDPVPSQVIDDILTLPSIRTAQLISLE